MAIQKLKFQEWLPDQPSVANTLQDVYNIIPMQNGFLPFPLAVDYSNAASESLLNVFAGKFNTTTQLFAGGATKLFLFDGSTLNLNDVSKTGGYSASRWYFVQFGNNVIAANDTSKLQVWTLGSSTKFADLAAAAPVAKYVTTVRDFVVAANLDGGTNANKVQWSNLNDETNWTSGAASQSDYQIIPDGGNITGIRGGEFGLIFLEKAIVRMSYIGSPLFFQFDNISRGLGCAAGGSIAQYNGISYFLSDDGFYMCDGRTVTAIGKEKVDRTFYDNCNINQLDSISASIDPVRGLVVWNYVNISGSRSLLVYNFRINQWSQGSTDVSYIASAAASGVTLEGLNNFGTVDSITTSFDDRLWVGGKYLFAGVRGSKIVTFTGANSPAYLIVGDWETKYNAVITLIRPQIEDGSASVNVSSRKNLADTITFGSTSVADSNGRCSVRSAGRYHQIKVTPTGNWTSMVSIDVETQDQGMR